MKSGYDNINCINGIQLFEKDLFMNVWMKDLVTPEERLNFEQRKSNKVLDCLIIVLIVGCISLLNSII